MTNRTGDERWGDGLPFELTEFLPHRIAVTARRVTRVLSDRYEQAFKLTVTELSVLTVVGQAGKLSPSAIADQTSMDKVRVSRATSVLAGRGLLRQNKDPLDGRGRVLRLTKKGQGIYDNVSAVAREVEAAMLVHFGKSDLASFSRILVRLNSALDLLEREVE